MIDITYLNRPVEEKTNVLVNTLILSVKTQFNRNYRKLPNKKLCVLLKRSPECGKWMIPSAPLYVDEDLDQSVSRALLGWDNPKDLYIEQLYTFSNMRKMTYPEVVVSYLALQAETDELSEELCDSDYCWFEIAFNFINSEASIESCKSDSYSRYYKISLSSLEANCEGPRLLIETNFKSKKMEPSKSLSVLESEKIGEIDSKVIANGIERLRNKIDYTDIVFHLMPQYFTLTELQQVYELIMDEKIYTAHFRRKIQPKLIKVDGLTKTSKGHRPAQLYMFNPYWDLNLERE